MSLNDFLGEFEFEGNEENNVFIAYFIKDAVFFNPNTNFCNSNEVTGEPEFYQKRDVDKCTPKVLEIAVATDKSFYDKHGSKANKKMMQKLNTTEGYFTKYFNLVFQLNFMYHNKYENQYGNELMSSSEKIAKVRVYAKDYFSHITSDVFIAVSHSTPSFVNASGVAGPGTTDFQHTTTVWVNYKRGPKGLLEHELLHTIGVQHSMCEVSGGHHTVMCSWHTEVVFGPSEIERADLFMNEWHPDRFLIPSNYAPMNQWTHFWDNNENKKWLGTWNLHGDDQYLKGDFDGDNDDEILFVNHKSDYCTMQDFKCEGVFGAQWYWKWSNGGNGIIYNWVINKNDKFFTGDFNGDGKDELLSISANSNYAHLNGFNNSTNSWYSEWANYGNHWIGGWYIQSSDDFIVADFTGDGRDNLLCVSASGWSKLLTYSGFSWTQVWSNQGMGWIGEGFDDGIPAFSGHRYNAGYITGSSNIFGSLKADLIAIYGTWATISNFDIVSNCWHWKWSQFGGGAPDVAGWHLPMNNHDFIQVGNLDYTDTKEELQFINQSLLNANWTCTMDYTGSHLVQNWNNGGNEEIADVSLNGDVEYLTLKPLSSVNTDMLLQIKNMYASNKFKCTLLKPSGTNKSNFFSNLHNNEDKGITYKIFPNPVEDYIIVSRENAKSNSKVEIYNLTGKVILNQNIDENNFVQSFDISRLESGLYLILVKQDNVVVYSSKFHKL